MFKYITIVAVPLMLSGCGLFKSVQYDAELHKTFQAYRSNVEATNSFMFDEERAASDEVYELEFDARTSVQKDLADAIELNFQSQDKGE